MSLRRRLLFAYLGPLLVTIASSLFVQSAFRASVASQHAVLESTEIVTAAQRMLGLVIDAETGLRGFLLSGSDTFLEPYLNANHSFEEQNARLRSQVARDAAQLARVRRISEIFHEWRSVVAEPQIAARRGPSSAEQVGRTVGVGQGKRRVDALRKLVTELIAIEQARLTERGRANELVTREAAWLALLAPVLAVAIALVIGITLSRRIVRSVESVASAAEGIAAGDLARRAHVQGSDEIARMAGAFNTMGEWLVARTREMDALRRLGEMLHVCNAAVEAHRVAAALAPQLFPDSTGVIWSLHASRSHLSPVAAWGAAESAAPSEPFPPEDCWALRAGKSYLVQPRGVEIRCAHARHGSPAAMLCVPLVAQGDTLGVLQLGRSNGAISEQMQLIAEAACEQLALALANLRLRESLRQQSIRDPLTGLFNRRYLEETLQRELARSRRARSQLGLLVVDVDHFKRVNDTEGHDAGDAVLRQLGELLGTTFRTSDIACRFGGEEFVIVLPDINAENLGKRADALRQSVQRMTVVVASKMLGPITISIGAALYPDHGENAVTLLHNGDQALYAAKREGRNRVVFAKDLVASTPRT